MPKTKLTDAGVKRYGAPANGRLEYFDTVLPAFGLRITKKGVKSWFVFYSLRSQYA